MDGPHCRLDAYVVGECPHLTNSRMFRDFVNGAGARRAPAMNDRRSISDRRRIHGTRVVHRILRLASMSTAHRNLRRFMAVMRSLGSQLRVTLFINYVTPEVRSLFRMRFHGSHSERVHGSCSICITKRRFGVLGLLPSPCLRHRALPRGSARFRPCFARTLRSARR